MKGGRMRLLALVFVLFYVLPLWADETRIEKNSPAFTSGFLLVDTDEPTQRWMLPFVTSNRHDISTVHVISAFGVYRSSDVKGHKHTGIDIVPRLRNGDYTWIYPIGRGVVCSVHSDHPHITVVVKHRTTEGKVIYSAYKHLNTPLVGLGAEVDTDTILGRIYSPFEGRHISCDFSHLHLEIRKKFDDLGAASRTTMTESDLQKRFYDPLAFLKGCL